MPAPRLVVVTALLLTLVPQVRATATAPDVFAGTGGTPPWFSGNTTPAAARPFGMVQLGPDTTVDGGPSRTASGYGWSDTRIRGFSATHVSGAGCRVFGDVPVLPVVGGVPDDPGLASVGFSHDREHAAPGWYRVGLDNGVGVRLAAGLRVGLATYDFPDARRGTLLLKAGGSLAGVTGYRLRFVGRRQVRISVTTPGFCGSPGPHRVHVLLRFDRAPVASGVVGDTGWASFAVRRQPRVTTQVAVSFVGPSGARRNLAAEDPGWSWRRLRDEAVADWDRELGRVRVSGGTDAERATFRAALYRVLLSPLTASDADGRYPGFDGAVHRTAPGRRHYSAVAGWDAYRTHTPLLAWLRPDVASDVVRSLHAAARQGGWYPKWPLPGTYTGVMGGDSAAPLIAGAWAFGARDVPLRAVARGLVRQAEAVSGDPGQGWFLPRPGLADYVDRGFVTGRHGASTTLEYALDDYAVSRVAGEAGLDDDAARLLGRSRSWRSLLDPERAMLLPREESGEVPPGYDPGSCCFHFEEGNAWQYQWSVPHDMAAALAAYGPREDVLARLDRFHEQLNAGAGRPHAWLGNQPSLSSPWAYLWLGEPARTQDVLDRARAGLWAATPGGIPGNDDLGGLAAWYVWSSLGLYPLTPGTSRLGVSRPAFDDVTVRPRGGTPTRIRRLGTGSYVTSTVVDGHASTRSWLARPPRDLVVATGPDDTGPWGTAPDDLPP